MAGLLQFKDLIAWQRAMETVMLVYGVTRSFPRDELYGLTSQIRRAAVSVPSNIAEGQGRGVSQDFVRFLRIAQGSRQELQTQMMIALRLQYVTQEAFDTVEQMIHETGRLISGLIRSLEPGIT